MTAQVHEKIVYEGQAYSLACEVGLPKHSRIFERSEEEAAASNAFCFSTACWRNYVGEWEVKSGRLYLTGIAGLYGLSVGQPLFAEWVSTTLRIPTGPLTKYVHGGHRSEFASELQVQVQNGIVVRESKIDGSKPDA